MAKSRVIDVAVGVVINADREVLIAKRPEGKPLSGVWEFPGGKLEPGETLYDALCRELKEELNIDVTAAKFWFETSYDYAEFPVKLHNWLVTEFAGEPESMEQQQFKWVSFAELPKYEFPAANISIVERLLGILFTGEI